MKRDLLFSGSFLLAAILVSSVAYAGGVTNSKRVEISFMNAVELRQDMRRLWEDHITYTRNYIISSLAGLEDIEKVSERLLANQEDIGNAMKPYYGDAAGNQVAALLRVHILIATEVINAAKIGNNGDFEKANKK